MGDVSIDQRFKMFGLGSNVSNENADPSSPQYKPLNSELREIRVLSLKPGKWDDPISCELSTILLNGSYRPYEALSYVWNAVTGIAESVLDGKAHHITKNLFLFLRRLCKASEERRLWADALCIDQESNVEKSYQVSLMREIYKSCKRVYLWLGDCSNPYSNTRTIEERDYFPWFFGTLVEEWTKYDSLYQAFNFLYELSKDGHLVSLSCYRSDDGGCKQFDPETLGAFCDLVSSTWWG